MEAYRLGLRELEQNIVLLMAFDVHYLMFISLKARWFLPSLHLLSPYRLSDHFVLRTAPMFYTRATLLYGASCVHSKNKGRMTLTRTLT